MTETQPTISSDSHDSAVPYRAIRQRWSEIVNSDSKQELGASSFLLYMALMGRDWRKGFSPIRNANRLANGAKPYQAMPWAMARVRAPHLDKHWLALFEGLITPEMLADVRSRLPKVHDMEDQLPDAPYVEVSNDAPSS